VWSRLGCFLIVNEVKLEGRSLSVRKFPCLDPLPNRCWVRSGHLAGDPTFHDCKLSDLLRKLKRNKCQDHKKKLETTEEGAYESVVCV